MDILPVTAFSSSITLNSPRFHSSATKTAVPATYLRDKLQAAQSAFPHFDLRLPSGWRNLTNAETQDLWDQKSEEFGFHDYSFSVSIIDEMIRRYDDAMTPTGGVGVSGDNPPTPTHSTSVPDASASPADKGIAIPPLSPQSSTSGEMSGMESSFSLSKEGDESDTSSDSQTPLVNFKRTESSTYKCPNNAFILALGEPDDGPAHPSYSEYYPSSPSPSVIDDSEGAAENLDITKDGLFIIYSEDQNEDFLMWWKRTAWYTETIGDRKSRHPSWGSVMRTPSALERFTQVAVRRTGEPRVICSFCDANLAHPQATRCRKTWTLESHLRSKSCREKQAEAEVYKPPRDIQPLVKKTRAHSWASRSSESPTLSPPPTRSTSRDSASYLLSPLADRPTPPNSNSSTSRRGSSHLRAFSPAPLNPAAGASEIPNSETAEIIAGPVSSSSPQNDPATFVAELSRPTQGIVLDSSAPPISKLAALGHPIATALEHLDLASGSAEAKKRPSVVDGEFETAIKRAKTEYMKKHNLRPKKDISNAKAAAPMRARARYLRQSHPRKR